MKIRVTTDAFTWESDQIDSKLEPSKEYDELDKLVTEHEPSSISVEAIGGTAAEKLLFDQLAERWGIDSLDNLSAVYCLLRVMKQACADDGDIAQLLFIVEQNCYVEDADEMLAAFNNGEQDEYHGLLTSASADNAPDALWDLLNSVLEDLPSGMLDVLSKERIERYDPPFFKQIGDRWYAADYMRFISC